MPPTTSPSPRWRAHFDPRSRHGQIYLLLLTLRCFSTFFGHGYIHPDEWMQSGEPYFGLTLPGIDAQIPWEWRPDRALRSFATLRMQYIAVDALVAIFQRLGPLTGHSLFLIQRANMLLWTVVLDINVALVLPPQIARYVHYTFGISTAATTFLIRPFSNSHEAHLLAFCLLHVLSFYKDRTWYKRSPLAGWHWGTLLAILTVDGFFTRFTFAIFVLPILVSFVYRLYGIAAEGFKRAVLFSLGMTTVAGIAFFAGRVDSETSWYTRSAEANGMQVAGLWGTGWVVPPINALLYNVKTENVAQHGLHPRWLHVGVNWPMMAGVANVGVVLWYGWLFVRDRRCVEGKKEKMEDEREVEQAVDHVASKASSSATMQPVTDEAIPYVDMQPLALTLSLSIIGLSLLLLSLSPHQEPRFLLALCFPSSLIMAYALSSRTFALPPHLTHFLLVLHVVQHLLQLILFSFLHQSSLLPALFSIDTSVSRLPFTNHPLFDRYEHHLIYRTFSPPFHLLPRKGRGMFPRVEAFDSTFTPADVVRTASIACDYTWVYAPSWVVSVLEEEAGKQGRVELVKNEVWKGHVDMDHLGESWELKRRVGWGEAFALQKLHVKCLRAREELEEEHEAVQAQQDL